ncbi:UTP--glucose-1-phosphate uridylyltransferase 3, chloroplastic isoform X3 [Rhododendron vialii]|uniref:UTP--glucose-1-phosphate uridylyltransferase 3, chloroplastic isoform X3 n=1 Tax=Rhododendron vialii TaxID=182163 RepID=UPI00265E3A3C|nr:UTP--glucose-1-phosphate uridylyltransferase 3, chloroplastic isoform X3 [Rhododendron vialii]
MARATPILHQNNLLLTPRTRTSHSLFNSPKPPPPLSPTLTSVSLSHHRVTRVSTAPLEHAPPSPSPDFRPEISRLKSLRSTLSRSKTLTDKLRAIHADSRVKRFFTVGVSRVLNDYLKLGDYELFLLKCVVAAGQEHVLGSISESVVEGDFESARGLLKSALYGLVEMIEKWDVEGGGGVVGGRVEEEVEGKEVGALRKLLKTLGEMERFYDCIGGIIGYQIAVLELLAQSRYEGHTINWSKHLNESKGCQLLEVHPPRVLDLSEDTEYASQAALWGIEGLPDLGEIYPLGGSADRLGLVDPHTGECLPAAMLPYCGRTLLEGLIRDLQAREFLYFKLYGKQCVTPVAIMTSSAKNNHERITSLCERLGWFGRGRSLFQFFEQPLVPAVGAEDGQWLVTRQFMPVCKPGGHGVIWKLAYDRGIFQWFYDHGRKGATVRQVRFDPLGIGGDWSAPWKELIASRESETSLPGMVLNTKKPITYVDQFGIQHRVPGGRLECTMQNIADNFFNAHSSRRCEGVEADNLDTFIVYNERRKVTSSAKKKRRYGDKSFPQTPDGSLLDIMRNAYDLLSHCQIEIPKIEGNDKYADSGPPYLIFLHPALGPLWEVTRQKFVGGSIAEGSELQVEVAEFLWRDVQLDGSLIVVAENILGSTTMDENGDPKLQYGRRCGRCKLQNVKVLNEGIDWTSGHNTYWKHDVQRFELLKVILHGNAEFEATDVILQGNHVFEVPNGYKLKITSGNSGLDVQLNPIEEKSMDTGSWFWNYKINGTHIQLELVEL